MKYKMMNSTGAALAISLTLVTPGFAQSFTQVDPVTPTQPVIVPSAPPPQVQIQQQPNAFQMLLQNVQQQQQIQNMFNAGQLPGFNPAISPMDQRSGLVNNANSTNGANNVQATLGITQGKPTIETSNLLNSSAAQVAQKDVGRETAKKFAGPNASNLYELLFLASNGQSVGLKPTDTEKTPTHELYGALVGLAKANNVPIADSLQGMFETVKSDPTMFDLVRPTLLQLANGIAAGTMPKQTLLSALGLLSNPRIIQGFISTVQSANLGKGASQAEMNKQIAEQIRQIALGTMTSGTTSGIKLPPALALFGSLNKAGSSSAQSSLLNIGSLLSANQGNARGSNAARQTANRP